MSSTHVCAHTFHRAHLLSAAAIFLIPSFAAHANELPGKERESAASTRQAAIKKTPEQSSRNTSKQLGAHVKTGAAVPISSNAAERLVVTATRTPQQIQDVPASVSLITRQDIQMRQSSTISDALNRLPDVDMVGTARMEGQVPQIRGFAGREIILMVDGARRNWDSQGIEAPLYIDPAFIQSVEVVAGSASTLYGTGGLGGVMSIKTIDAKSLLKPGQGLGGEIDGGYQSANGNGKGSAKIYGKWGKFDALLAYSGQTFNSIRLGGGERLSPNDGQSHSALLKLGYDINDRIRIDFGQQFYLDENYRSSVPQEGPSTYHCSTCQEQNVRQDESTLHLTTRNEQGEEDGRLTLYRTKMASKQVPNSMDSNGGSTVLETYGFDLQKSYFRNFGLFGRHKFTGGVNYYRDFYTYTTSGSNTPNAQQQVYGVYGQDEIKFRHHVTLSPSLRYDRYNTFPEHGKGLSNSSNGAILPKITLSWQPTREWMIYLSWGKAYNVPTPAQSDMDLTGNQWFANFVSNKNLKPESAKTYEGGFTYTKSALFSEHDRASVRATGFYEDVTNLIQEVAIGRFNGKYGKNRPIYQYQNVGHATRYGIELHSNYDIGNWGFDLSFSHIRVTNARTGAGLYSPPDKVAADMRYRFPNIGLTLMYSLMAVDAQNYDATIIRRRPGYMVHDILATWAPPRKPWRINFAVTNLFDKEYSMYKMASTNVDFPEVGRSFRFDLSYRF